MSPKIALLILVAATAAKADQPSPAPGVAVHPAKYNAALHDELVAMIKPDQAVRQKRASEYTKEDFERMRAIDAAHETRMREIVHTFGWPGRSLVGSDGATDAWLLVQHCSLAFEEECLPLLKHAVDSGEVEPKNYAYLLDRVRMYKGEPQVYGTQFMNGALYNLEDPDHVDERRKSVGLGPEAEYVKKLQSMQ